jgi:DtxR family Mn-dependent transcriptional regulator
MTSSPALSSSLEDYLEAIFHIVAEKSAARAKDIADRLRVKASSVTGALRALAERGLVHYAPYDVITLTEKGRRAARGIVRRHSALRDFLVKVLGVGKREAETAACGMEHAVSGPILDRLVRFVEIMESCPRCGAEWIREVDAACPSERERTGCEDCIALSLGDLRDRKGGGGA